VQWFNDRGDPCRPGVGKPDFRVMDSNKFKSILHGFPYCWVCGGVMGVHQVFSIGPMCSINRIISEPPSHRSCAEYSVRACPFLSKPKMRRNEKDLPGTEETRQVAGIHIDRNPGVVCLWETMSYRPFKAGPGVLFKLSDPIRTDWYCEGRPATRAEVLAAIESGYPLLEQLAKTEGNGALEELTERRRVVVETLVPA